LESEGELISELHPYEIRVSLAHGSIKKSIWLEGHIIHLREGELHCSEGISLVFVAEKIAGRQRRILQGILAHFFSLAETTTFRSESHRTG
jgi:hypothetical protein